MSTSIDLDALSMESGELFAEETRPDAAIADEAVNPIHSKEFEDMALVFETYETITTRRYICREDIERIKELTGSYPQLGKLIKKFPINSFSEEPSRINYDVSTESFVKSAYEAVVQALKDILQFIVDSVGKLWKFLTDNGQKTAAVDDMDSKLRSIQTYIVEVDKIASGSSVSEDFRKVREGAFTNEYHNLTKRWTAFRQKQLNDPEGCLSDLTIMAGVFKTKLPPFIDAVDGFLLELAKAETEQDVELAIAKIELFDMTSSQFFMLSKNYGYSANVKTAASVTDFQAKAMVIRNNYRGLINDRAPLDRVAYNNAIVTYQIVNWGKEVNEVIAWAKGRTDPITKAVDAFNVQSLKPGLEDVYMNRLVPSFKAITSVLAGFTAIEQCMGLLTDNRNNVGLGIAKAALGIAKKIDVYVVANKAKFTIAEQNIIWRNRKALSASFTD